MKKAFKRTTAAIMAAMILATTATTVTVFATETTGTTENGSPANGNTNNEGTGTGATVSATKLPEAVNGVITLQNDVTISYSDWVALNLKIATTDVTIDLNGNTLTYTDIHTVEVEKGAKLTIKNGTIEAKNFAGDKALISVASKSSVTVENVTIDTTASALYPFGDAASVTVKDSTIKAGVYAVATNAGTDDNYNVVITLKDSNFSTPYGWISNDAIYKNDSATVVINVPGTLNVDNCTISGNRQAVFVRAGTANIKDSTINYTGSYSGDDANKYDNAAWSGGDNVPMAAVVVGNRTNNGAYKNSNCTLTNTTVNAQGKRAIYYYSNEFTDDTSNTYDAKLTINSGTITGDIVAGPRDDKDNLTATGFKVTGGIFVTSTSVGEYTATGYEAAGVYDKSGNPAYLVGEDGITTSGTATNPTARITGGTFNFDPSDYVESGYVASQSNGKYVVSKYVAPAVPSTPADTSKTETTTDPSTGTTTTTTTTTKADGSTTEEKIETTTDGTKTETKTETKADGSSTSSSTVTDVTGNVVEKSETKVEVKEDKSTTETTTTTKPQEETKVETTVEKDAKGEVTKETTTTSSTNAEDLSKVIVEKENTENSKGADVAQTTTTVINSAGATESVTEEQVIENIGNKTDAVVTVEKNGSGEVQNAEAVVEKTGATKGAAVQATITNKVVSQIVEAAGEDAADVMSITINVTDEQGNDKYTVTVDKEALKPGANLTIYKKNKDGELIMVNDRDYKVSKNGNVKLVIKSSNDFVLLSEEQNKAEEACIMDTIAAKNSKKTIKKNKTTTMALQDTLDMANVQKIDYKSSKPSVAHINANGKIRGKKSGTVTIKAIITLKNGSKKTVSMKLTVA